MRPRFRSQSTAVLVGGVLVVAGFFCLYDAFEGRGIKSPWFLGPFKPW